MFERAAGADRMALERACAEFVLAGRYRKPTIFIGQLFRLLLLFRDDLRELVFWPQIGRSVRASRRRRRQSYRNIQLPSDLREFGTGKFTAAERWSFFKTSPPRSVSRLGCRGSSASATSSIGRFHTAGQFAWRQSPHDPVCMRR